MKNSLKRFFIGLLALLIFSYVQGQELTQLPIDSAVRYGKLENGLTYYIRKNAYPKDQADFYIAQKVGSMQEEDSQWGLAHFLEHMAFNGTKHFPGRKTMLDYLEKNGAQFGTNVNAYTSFDETVYNLTNIPITRSGVLDSCLLILHDWSGFISLEDKEIDQERKIIKEEWRNRSGANSRIWDKILPILFEGSKYANRMPIGSMDVVENFKYQELKDYYKKWYRPDLQGIVVVGDFDAEEVENKIKELFSDIPKPVNAEERIYYTVANNEAPVIAIATDPELTSTSISLYFKHNVQSTEIKQSVQGVYLSILDMFVSHILSARYREIAQKSDAPFLSASVSNGPYLISRTKMAWNISASCKEGQIEPALQALVRETERAKKFGFLESEVDRIKDNLLQAYEDSYNNREKQRTNTYANEYVNSFVDNEPIPGIETMYSLIKQLLPQINADVLNGYVNSINLTDNMSIVITGPEKDNLKYPLGDDLISLIQKTKTEELSAYKEELLDEPLISQLPTKGKIIKTENSIFDTKTWTLSNGIKVVLKKTDFKDDQILMRSTSQGGTSLFADNEVFNASLISGIPSIGGLGNFSNVNIGKKLAGKSADVACSVTLTTQGVNMNSNIKDIETALQLVYLVYTSPRQDNQAFGAYMERVKNALQNASMQPSVAFNDTINYIMYGDNPRAKSMKLNDVTNLNYDRIYAMYKECFQKTAPAVFTFVGTIDESVLRPLVEQYIATLPVGDKNRKSIDRNLKIKTGEKIVHFNRSMETPKTSVCNIYSRTLHYDQKNRIVLNIFNQILDLVFTRTIREEEGGTYGVSSNIDMSRIPLGQTTLTMSYTTDSSKVENLNKIASQEIYKIAQNGPETSDFNKAIEFIKKNHADRIKTNNYWLSIINTYSFYNEDNYTTYLDTVNTISTDDVRKIAKKLLDQKNYKEVIMYP